MSETQATHTEVSAAPPSANEAPIAFFGIGLVINLVLLAAFFAWARKQWKQSEREDE